MDLWNVRENKNKEINKNTSASNSTKILHDIILQFYFFISNGILHSIVYLC